MPAESEAGSVMKIRKADSTRVGADWKLLRGLRKQKFRSPFHRERDSKRGRGSFSEAIWEHEAEQNTHLRAVRP